MERGRGLPQGARDCVGRRERFMTGAVQLAGAFEADGAIARVLPSFRPRPGQQALAGAIEDCLNEGTDLIAEAATGTCKTLAYLVPVLLRDQRTIISTGTLHPQDPDRKSVGEGDVGEG